MKRKEGDSYDRRKGMNIFIFLIYLVFGAYFINYPFSFVSIPEYVSEYDLWIIFAGGILMLFGAVNYFRANRR